MANSLLIERCSSCRRVVYWTQERAAVLSAEWYMTIYLLKSRAGVWALDFAAQHPTTVRIDGADISAALFPSEHPSNVRFTEASAARLPLEWASKFDFVNQRLLLPGLLASEWLGDVSEIYRVLRPGGSVQFLEIDPDWPGGPRLPVSEKVKRIFMTLHAAKGTRFDCALLIPTLLKEAGFVDIHVVVKDAPVGQLAGEMGLMGSAAFGGAIRNIGPVAVKAGGDPDIRSITDYSKLMDDLFKEWDTVDGAKFKLTSICAKKPIA